MGPQANFVSLFCIKKYFRIKKRRHCDAVDKPDTTFEMGKYASFSDTNMIYTYF